MTSFLLIQVLFSVRYTPKAQKAYDIKRYQNKKKLDSHFKKIDANLIIFDIIILGKVNRKEEMLCQQ